VPFGHVPNIIRFALLVNLMGSAEAEQR
jgi:hypothetical protein